MGGFHCRECIYTQYYHCNNYYKTTRSNTSILKLKYGGSIWVFYQQIFISNKPLCVVKYSHYTINGHSVPLLISIALSVQPVYKLSEFRLKILIMTVIQKQSQIKIVSVLLVFFTHGKDQNEEIIQNTNIWRLFIPILTTIVGSVTGLSKLINVKLD